MFDWIVRLIGKDIASKAGLEGNMTDTPVDTKPWYKSRSIWASIATVILGGVGPISTAFGHPIVVPQWLIQFLIGAGIYTSRTATTDIQ